MYAISSEVQSRADEAFVKWKLGRYDAVIGDNGNSLVGYLKRLYIPALVITDCHDKHNANGLNNDDYPTGAVQPALLIFVGSNPALVWATRPTAANLQGSLNRPDPNDVWTKVVYPAYRRYKRGLSFECSDGADLHHSAGIVDLIETDCPCGCCTIV